MNQKYNQSIIDLVADYEAMAEQGTVTFMDERTYEELLKYYEQEEQIDRALEVVEYAIKHHSYSADFYIKQAYLLLYNKEVLQALASLDQAAIYAPSEPEIALLRAEAFIKLGQLEEAHEILDDLKGGAEGVLLSDILTVEALIYEKREMYELSYFTLKAALREHPTNQSALENIWNSVVMCKNFEEATRLFEGILEKDAYCSIAWYNLGHCHAFQNNYASAIEAYEYAYLSDEQFEQAYRECAELCLELKLYHKARRCYEELLEHFEADCELLQNVGQCHQHLGNFQIARTFYAQALNYDPMNDEVLFYIGECFAEEENWTGALRYYQKAIDIEDSREEYYGGLAEAHYHLGQYENAKTNFERAIDVAPEESRYWIEYACFLMETDGGEEALELMEEAEEHAAGMEILYCRVACLFLLGRRQEGLYWLGEALMEDYDSHRTLFDLMPELEQDPEIISMISAHMM